jgi:hypothetical protein
MGPCAGMTGLDKVKCTNDERKKNMVHLESTSGRMNTAAHERVAACSDKTGTAKANCLRSLIMTQKVNAMQKKIQKVETKATNKIMKIQEKVKGMQQKLNMKMMKKGSSSSSSSAQ